MNNGPDMTSSRHALITGASSGIGAAFVAQLPPETDLLLTGRRGDRLRAAADRHGHGTRAVAIVIADLALESGRSEVVGRAAACEIDLLVCNAGAGVYGSFAASSLQAQRDALELNVIAPCVLVHALLPGMLQRARATGRRAGIVIVGSVAGFAPMPEAITYAAAKSFALQFGRGLAAQLRHEPIDVLTLLPTYTRTEFFSRAGLPEPRDAMSAEDVAREAMQALGEHDVYFCGWKYQALAWLLASNPIVKAWRWPQQLLDRLRRRLR
jgi:short-subunit dehydrogenase